MKKVICLGSATRDIFVLIDKIRVLDNPDQNETTAKKFFAFEFGSKIYADSFWEEVGGSAVNVAAVLVKCDKKPFVFSRVSKGEIGKWITKRISRLKIKKNYLQKKGGLESEISVIISDKSHQDHVILRTGDSVESFDAAKAFDKFREKVDWIFIASQKKGWEKTMEKVINFAQKKKARIALNPSSYQLSQGAKKLREFIDKVEIIFLNKDEAIELIQSVKGTAGDKTENLLKEILAWGAPIVAITDGERGAYAGNSEGIFHLETIGEKRVETTGAGDAFAGAFLAANMEGREIRECLCWGIANSGAVISKRGATKGILKKKELLKKEKEIIDRVKKIF